MRINSIYTASEYEVDHRISNNLSIISALLRHRAKELERRIEPLNGAEARLILEEAAFQVEVIASLHRLLSDKRKGATIDLDQYLGSVCNAAVPRFSSRFSPQYRLNSSQHAAPEFAVSIALAVAELIINAIKYAHPSGVAGTITVAAMTRGEDVVFEVADDGVGLPEGHDPAGEGTLGLRLVRSTAARWGGTVEFDADGLGLCVRLVIPAKACQGKA